MRVNAAERNSASRRGIWRSTFTLAALALALVVPSTASATAPTVMTKSAQDVTSSSALLRGTVNPNDRPTRWWFEYATAAEWSPGTYPHATEQRDLAFGFSAVQIPTLLVTSGVSWRLEGLSSSTTYHFRVAASNADGTSFGDDATFTTTS